MPRQRFHQRSTSANSSSRKTFLGDFRTTNDFDYSSSGFPYKLISGLISNAHNQSNGKVIRPPLNLNGNLLDRSNGIDSLFQLIKILNKQSVKLQDDIDRTNSSVGSRSIFIETSDLALIIGFIVRCSANADRRLESRQRIPCFHCDEP